MSGNSSCSSSHPIKESIYWNWDRNCPQIFIDAVCKNEGLPDAQAGYGLNTHSDPKSRIGGRVPGLQTARRAHLWSISEALEWTCYSHQLLIGECSLESPDDLPCFLPAIKDRVVVVSKENVVWKQVRGDRAAGDEDLWEEIDCLLEKLEEKKVEVFFAGIDQYFDIPTALAHEEAVKCQSDENPLNSKQLSAFMERIMKSDLCQNVGKFLLSLQRKGLLKLPNSPSDSAETGSDNKPIATSRVSEPPGESSGGSSSNPEQDRQPILQNLNFERLNLQNPEDSVRSLPNGNAVDYDSDDYADPLHRNYYSDINSYDYGRS